MQQKTSIITVISLVVLLVGGLFMAQKYFSEPQEKGVDTVYQDDFDTLMTVDFSAFIVNDEDNVVIINSLSEEKKQEIRDGIIIWQERQDGSSIEPYLQEATLQSSLGDQVAALAVLEKAENIFPENSTTLLLNKAEIYRRTGRYLDAANTYQKALETNRDNANTYINFGDLLVKFAFDKSIAADVYLVGLAETDNHLDLLTGYARYLDEVVDDKEASLEYWQKALEVAEGAEAKDIIQEEIDSFNK